MFETMKRFKVELQTLNFRVAYRIGQGPKALGCILTLKNYSYGNRVGTKKLNSAKIGGNRLRSIAEGQIIITLWFARNVMSYSISSNLPNRGYHCG